ncbi:hypothetical protein ACO2KH_18720 [Leptospira terpstrae]|uniref:hypothetical protein n=1 Tax=Leptospira terpstrae TaxID=293075 RepID=UPI003D03331C
MKKNLLTLLILILTISVIAQENIQKNSIETNYNDSDQSISIVKKNYQIVIDELSKLKISQEAQNTEINKLKETNKALINRIDYLENSYMQNMFSGSIGAFILLLGLLIEIIGATLLAGNNLSAKLQNIYSLSIKADLGDLALTSVTKDEVMKFYGYIGSILLIMGFLLQMTGTIFVLGIHLITKSLIILLSCLISFSILYYLMGQTPEQTRSEKLKVIWRNINGQILLPLYDKIFQKSTTRCDYCLKKCNNGIVSYISGENSENYPYLHSPQLYHYSHEDCLSNIDDYQTFFNKSEDALSTNQLYKHSILEFKTKIYPDLKDFFIKQKNDRKGKWKNYNVEKPDYSEIETEKMFHRIKSL